MSKNFRATNGAEKSIDSLRKAQISLQLNITILNGESNIDNEIPTQSTWRYKGKVVLMKLETNIQLAQLNELNDSSIIYFGRSIQN